MHAVLDILLVVAVILVVGKLFGSRWGILAGVITAVLLILGSNHSDRQRDRWS